jgi:hypothetical protein
LWPNEPTFQTAIKEHTTHITAEQAGTRPSALPPVG